MALTHARGSGFLINSPRNRDCPGFSPTSPQTPRIKILSFQCWVSFQTGPLLGTELSQVLTA